MVYSPTRVPSSMSSMSSPSSLSFPGGAGKKEKRGEMDFESLAILRDNGFRPGDTFLYASTDAMVRLIDVIKGAVVESFQVCYVIFQSIFQFQSIFSLCSV